MLGAYPKGEHLEEALLGWDLASFTNVRAELERLVSEKHSSLSKAILNCGRKMFLILVRGFTLK
jgi:hypothetical protein